MGFYSNMLNRAASKAISYQPYARNGIGTRLRENETSIPLLGIRISDGQWPMNLLRALVLSCSMIFASHSAFALVTTTNVPRSIVTLREGADVDSLIQEINVKPSFVYRHALKGFAAAMDSGTVETLKQDGRILAVEPDGKIFPCEQTNSTGIIRMGLTNFPIARINGLDGRINVDVAVLDTGIQPDHPDLNVYRSVGFADPGLDGNDWEGHGTHVAGIIGALDNAFGVVGVAPGVRLWSVQVIGRDESGWANFLAGMDYVAQNADTISVVNLSIIGQANSSTPYEAIHQAVITVVNQGVVVVAGAGNNVANIAGADRVFGTNTDGISDDILPAALGEVLTVPATDPVLDRMWWSSNFARIPRVPNLVNSPGAGIDVAAPGVDILSTDLGGTYSTRSGTSAATAHVSGLVALYVAANGRGHNAENVRRIRQKIIDAGQPQSQWLVPDGDVDHNPEPLALPSESWIPQPRIFNQSATPQGFQFSFTTVPGYSYTPQRTDLLSHSNQWTDLTATNGTGDAATVLDPVLNAIRFYRVKRQPAP